jgi:hypothetical protein
MVQAKQERRKSMDKIAEPCCGSCIQYLDHGGEGTFCDIYNKEWPEIDDYCNDKDYSPHNPIDNPYKKYKDMWDELGKGFEGLPDIETIGITRGIVLRTIKSIEEKHK